MDFESTINIYQLLINNAPIIDIWIWGHVNSQVDYMDCIIKMYKDEHIALPLATTICQSHHGSDINILQKVQVLKRLLNEGQW